MKGIFVPKYIWTRVDASAALTELVERAAPELAHAARPIAHALGISPYAAAQIILEGMDDLPGIHDRDESSITSENWGEEEE